MNWNTGVTWNQRGLEHSSPELLIQVNVGDISIDV